MERFSIECRRSSGNHSGFGFGFSTVRDWASRVIGNKLIWAWFDDSQLKTALEWHKTKTKVITLGSHKGRRQYINQSKLEVITCT